MTTRQPGLRKRMELEARRIFHQHEQLDQFYAVTAWALEGEDARAARQAYRNLQDALESHFQVEERTHFPALHGLEPGTEEVLAGLVREHDAFRDRLAQLDRTLAVDDLAEGGRQLKELGEALERHEKAEERLFASATGTPPPSR